MGRAVVTKGHRGRRLGRAIRKLEESVEFSSKETLAKQDENRFREKAQTDECDSPVENLRYPNNPKKEA